MLQVVLDTNVLLSALRSRRNASYRLLTLVGDVRWQLNLSTALVLEYEDVLKRPEIGLSLTHEEIDAILDYLCDNSNHHRISYLWRPFLRDAKDDFVLELAVASGCDYIVTFNAKDFTGIEHFGLKTITPGEFLHKLEEAT
jgi:putative PIN family toxin of toxin-antitoxin system